MKLFKCSLCLLIAITFIISSPAWAVRLKIATISPDGSFWMEKMREGAEEVEQKTDGRVQIKYYPGGVMGDDTAVMRKIRIGQLQGGAFVAGSLSNVFSDIQIYGLPLVFKNLKEVDYVRERIDPMIIEGLEKSGFVAFGLAEGGFAYIMSQSPIRSVKELQERKMWIPNDDKAVQEGVKTFGINAIPLSIADVRAGLQTGLIDTVGTSPIGAVALQWHTQIKYLTDLPFLYVFAVLTVDKKSFEKIKPEDQPIVREVLGRVFHEIDRQNRKDNIAALEAMQKQGIEIIKPSDEELAEWKRLAQKVPEHLVSKGIFSQEIVDSLETNLKEFRSK